MISVVASGTDLCDKSMPTKSRSARLLCRVVSCRTGHLPVPRLPRRTTAASNTCAASGAHQRADGPHVHWSSAAARSRQTSGPMARRAPSRLIPSRAREACRNGLIDQWIPSALGLTSSRTGSINSPAQGCFGTRADAALPDAMAPSNSLKAGESRSNWPPSACNLSTWSSDNTKLVGRFMK